MSNLKSIFAATVLVLSAGFATASDFGTYSTTVTQSVLDALKNPANATGGQLTINSGSEVSVTFLGHTATYTNSLFQVNFSGALFVNQTAALDSVQIITGLTSPSIVPFILTVDQEGDGVIDYTLSTGTDSVKLIDINGETFMGFEDNLNWDGTAGGDMDYNDLIYKVSGVTITNVAPIPEPSTYALMLAGLMSMGFIARRRSKQA